jgi:3-oxoadipate enol-lactonase
VENRARRMAPLRSILYPPSTTFFCESVMSVKLTIYPDQCDAYGHLNQAAYLALFERARWELLARGPGMDVFERAGVWPAVRRATVDYHAGVWPGDVLDFTTELVSRGRTSFTLRQRAVRDRDARLAATLETVFVCIDHDERPVAIPDSVLATLAAEPRRATVANGVTLAWDEAGQQGHVVVLLHGYPFDRTMWRDQLVGVHGHRLIALDLRGFGASERGEGPLTVESYADDVAALLDTLGHQRAVVVGLSMGGYVALAFAERHRTRLAGLVLMDTKASPDDEAGRKGRDQAIATITADGTSQPIATMMEKLFAEDTQAEVRERVLAMMQRATPAAMIAALGALRDRPDRRPLLPQLDGIPTLVIVGKDDRLTPPEVNREMAEAVPGADFVLVEGAGHLPPMERPQTVNEALQPFLDRVV